MLVASDEPFALRHVSQWQWYIARGSPRTW